MTMELTTEQRSYYNGERICNTTNQQIVNKLKYIIVLVGCDKLPNNEETLILVDFIKNDLKKYYLEEMVLAFKLALKGEIEADLNHYNTFSVNYLCRVMRVYEKWRQKNYKPKQNIMINEKNSLSDEEKEQIVKEGLVDEYTHYKLKKEFKSICPQIYLDYLWKNKLIKPTEKEIKDIKTLSETELKSRLDAEKSTSNNIYEVRKIAKKILNLTSENEFKTLCKVNYLKLLFDKKEITEILCHTE